MPSTRFAPIQPASEPAVMQPAVRHSVATLFANSVVAGVRWNCFCSSAGVISITTTIAADSIHVSSIDTITARPWSRSTAFSGISAASAFFAFISANTGVSCSQRRRYTENSPNTPPSRNGMRHANAPTSAVE